MNEKPILMHARSINGILEGRKTQTRRIIKPQPPEGWDRHCWFDAPIYGFTWDSQPATEWHKVRCPYISSDQLTGDRLWVREVFFIDDLRYEKGPLPKERPHDVLTEHIYYRADGECCDQIPECECADSGKPRWKPGIHMPRWASRLTLEITNIRVERVQDISEADAKAEGVEWEPWRPWWQGYHRDMLPEYSHFQYRGDEPPEWMIEPHPCVNNAHDPLERKPVGEFKRLWDDTNGSGAWDRNDWCWVVDFRRLNA